MKTLLLWLLVLVLGAGLVLYFNPEWAAPLRSAITGKPDTTTVYKWRDAAGEWHVTDTPPPPGTDYQVQEYLSDSNVVPAAPSAAGGSGE